MMNDASFYNRIWNAINSGKLQPHSMCHNCLDLLYAIKGVEPGVIDCDLEITSYMGWADKHVAEYPIVEWVCTDTHVGLYAYVYQDAIIAFSTQYGRKSDMTFWIVNDIAFDLANTVTAMFMDTPSIDDEKVIEERAKDIVSYAQKMGFATGDYKWISN